MPIFDSLSPRTMHRPSYPKEMLWGYDHFLSNPSTMSDPTEYTNKLLDARAELHAALVKAVAETQDVHADSTNPFHKNKYASLSAHLAVVKPIFAKHGLAVLQFPTSSEKSIGVTTTIVHKSGSQIMDTITIPVGDGVKGQDAGSIISYLRRYSLAAIAGIATEDDDAESDRIVRTPSPSAGSGTISTTKFIPNPNATAPTASVNVDFALPVPFGKNKGTALQDLPDSDLDYWANKWEPKPWEKTGKVGPKDLSLKASAQALWASKQGGSTATDSQDEVPF